jgi:phospholipid/cholesterol/gamma-HCH transport system substrate-binding protein
VRSRWNLPVYAAYVALSVVVLGFIVAGIGLTLPGTHRYTVTATFSDAADILVGNEVFMNGTRVGHVGAVSVRRGAAEVALVIDDSAALPLRVDASAEIRKKNLLGETYVDLQRGGAAQRMADGGVIPERDTVPITEIDQVLAIFDPVTVQRVQLLINAAGQALTDNGANMNSESASLDDLLTSLDTPATELAVRRQQVEDIVLELQRFYDLLARQRTQVTDEFTTWNQVMAQLAAQEQGIAGTLQQADTLLQGLNRLVSGESGNIRAVLQQLGAGGGGVLDTTDRFLDTSNQILAGLAPYRQYIDDVFPDLATSFADTSDGTAGGQHFWSVFSVSCEPGSCASGARQAAAVEGPATGTWSEFTPGGPG